MREIAEGERDFRALSFRFLVIFLELFIERFGSNKSLQDQRFAQKQPMRRFSAVLEHGIDLGLLEKPHFTHDLGEALVFFSLLIERLSYLSRR